MHQSAIGNRQSAIAKALSQGFGKALSEKEEEVKSNKKSLKGSLKGVHLTFANMYVKKGLK